MVHLSLRPLFLEVKNSPKPSRGLSPGTKLGEPYLDIKSVLWLKRYLNLKYNWFFRTRGLSMDPFEGKILAIDIISQNRQKTIKNQNFDVI